MTTRAECDVYMVLHDDTILIMFPCFILMSFLNLGGFSNNWRTTTYTHSYEFSLKVIHERMIALFYTAAVLAGSLLKKRC